MYIQTLVISECKKTTDLLTMSLSYESYFKVKPILVLLQQKTEIWKHPQMTNVLPLHSIFLQF